MSHCSLDAAAAGDTAPTGTASVVISPGADISTFTPGLKIDLTATTADSYGASATVKTAAWSVSDPAILFISVLAGPTTTVTARGTGAAKVIASNGGKADTVNITVIAPVFSGVRVSPPSTSLAPAASQQLTATAVDQNGISFIAFAAPTFSSSNTTVATVTTSGGIVTAVANGSTTITATIAGTGVTRTGTSAITVQAAGSFPTTAVINAQGAYTWDPTSVDIAATGSVMFGNGTPYTHNVTFSAASGAPMDIPDFSSGSQSAMFPTARTYNFHCSIHPGMTGMVIVH